MSLYFFFSSEANTFMIIKINNEFSNGDLSTIFKVRTLTLEKRLIDKIVDAFYR